MAHKKAGGSSRNGRDSAGKRLGVKMFGGQSCVAGNPGDIIEFGEVLVVGGDTPTLGTPTIAGATVAGEVLEQGRGPKVIAFKKRRRKNSRRKRGHRQEFTLVRITEILTDGKKPSQTPPPRAKKSKPKPKDATQGETAGDAPPA